MIYIMQFYFDIISQYIVGWPLLSQTGRVVNIPIYTSVCLHYNIVCMFFFIVLKITKIVLFL